MDANAERRRFVEILRGFRDAQLVTRSPAGMLHARPMVVADVQDDGTAWFVTSARTPKVAEIEERSQVVVTFQSANRFASLSGRARVVNDRARVRALWSDAWRPWFPQGPDTEDLVLLAVEPLIGEYWDQSGAKGLRYLWEAAKAVARGERLDDGVEEGKGHAKVDL